MSSINVYKVKPGQGQAISPAEKRSRQRQSISKVFLAWLKATDARMLEYGHILKHVTVDTITIAIASIVPRTNRSQKKKKPALGVPFNSSQLGEIEAFFKRLIAQFALTVLECRKTARDFTYKFQLPLAHVAS